MRWIAQDNNDAWWGYSVEPLRNDTGWYENEVGDYIHLGSTDNTGWEDSLRRIEPSRAAMAQEEIFGPVLATLPVPDFDNALQIANSTAYALTGGVYPRSPANLRKAARDFRVGNLYLNRGITGALVGRQPFGGFRLSGTASKAGGRDYLQLFMEPRCVTENTLRRGGAPEPD